MDRLRFSSIAHRHHVMCSPVDVARIDEVLGMIRLSPGDRVLDIGCGKAEVLIRLAERRGARAEGVDTSPYFLEEARERAKGHVPPGGLVLHQVDAADFQAPAEAYQLAMCIGASHVWGDYGPSLERLAASVRRGGYVLAGEPFWKQPPRPDFLEKLGAKGNEHQDHSGNVRAGLERGLTFLQAWTSSDAEWDQYEGLYCHSLETYALEHPDDPELDAYLERGRRIRDRYYGGGRETLGFGMYLFLKP